MFGIGVRCSKNATLFGRPNYKRHIKSQPLEVTHDKAFIAKWPTGKWAILLSQYEMHFYHKRPLKDKRWRISWLSIQIRGQPNFTRISQTRSLKFVWPRHLLKDKCGNSSFDGASRIGPQGHVIAGVGVVLFSLQNYVIPRAFSLTKPCSNNVAEYDALLIGMQIANEIGVKNLEAYGDSKLIIN